MSAPTAAFFGRTTLDVLYILDALPAEDTKVFARDFRAVPGGPACNAAITHTLLGGDATLFTALGKGLWADAVRAELARFEVEIVDIAAGTPYETPLTTVLTGSANGTRTIVNPPVMQRPSTRFRLSGSTTGVSSRRSSSPTASICRNACPSSAGATTERSPSASIAEAGSPAPTSSRPWSPRASAASASSCPVNLPTPRLP